MKPDLLDPPVARPLIDPEERARRRRETFVNSVCKIVTMVPNPTEDRKLRAAFAAELLSNTLPPEITVSILYRRILDREPDPEGLERNAARIARSGTTAILQVARSLGGSAELKGASPEQQEEALELLTSLGIDPDQKAHPLIRFGTAALHFGVRLTKRALVRLLRRAHVGDN